MGADIFSQKFCPKQRESDATTRQKTLRKVVIWVFPRMNVIKVVDLTRIYRNTFVFIFTILHYIPPHYGPNLGVI